MVALLGVTGEVNAAETPRKIVNDLTNGSATWYSDASKSAEITSVPYAAAAQTLYIDIQPAEGYWTSADELNGLVEKYVSPSAAESRTRSADISIAQYQVKTVSGQTYADNGGGLYQVTIPGMGSSTDADKITKFVLTADFVACTDIGGDDSGGGGGGGSGITATAESTVYNGQNQTAVLKLGDTELTKGTDYTVDAGSSDTYKDADTYTIAITGKGRYKGTANVAYTIAKKEVGLTWTNNTPYLFNGSAQAPSVKVKDGDLVSGDACTVGVTIAAKTGSHLSSNKEAVDVGEYTATATGLSNSNYKLKDDADVSEDFSIVVNSSDVVVVTITGHNSTATYDGQSHSVSGYDVTSISNALYAESDFTFNGTATATRTDAGTTNMGLAASQFTNTNANFSVTFNVTDGFVTINRKGVNPNPDSGNGEGKVSITVDPTSFEYNGKAQKPTVTVKDGEAANAPVIDAAEYTVSYKNSKGEAVNETKNVGTYTIVITNKDGGNYVVNGTATYDITQKALTVTAKAKTIAYGSEASNDGVTYSGFVEGESATTEGLFSGSLTYQYNSKADGSGEAYKTSSPVGTYYIIPSGLSAKNYVISYVAGTLTVSNQVIVIGGGDDAEANATVSVTPTEFTYNGKAQKPEVKITLKDGNTVIPASEYDLKYKDAEGHEVSVTKNAGSYTLEISNKAGADYAFSGKTTANYTIKPKALTVKAEDKTKKVGEEDPEFTYTYDGLVEGDKDVFSGALTRDEGEAAGTYTIKLGTLSAGTNYTITYTSATLTIEEEPSPAPTPEEPEYTIKVVKTDGGKVTSNRGKAKKGKQVKLTVAADEDYYLTSISVVNDKTQKEVTTNTAYDKENNLYYTFTMPAANVTVKGTFAKKEKDQNIFIFRNNYGEIVSNVLHADPGQQVNLVRRLKNGYTNTELDELYVINDEGQQLQLFFYDNPNDVEHPVWFFFMKGKSVQIYNSFKGTNGVVDQSKSNSLRLEDGTLLFLLSDLYKSFFKTGEGTEAAQLAMSYVANILANFNASGELSVDKGPDDVDMALLNLLEGWKVMIDFEGVIKILNAEMLGLSDGARLTSGKIYELLTPGNLHLLLHSAYGPLLIKSITLIAPEPEPEEPVAINGLKADKAAGDIYDLRGRKVDTNSLRKGIYIRDGRKIVIK